MLTALLDGLLNRRPSHDEFARRFIEAAHRAGWTTALVYEPDTFRVVHDNGLSNLHNAYQAYVDARWNARDAVLMRFVALLQLQNEQEETLEDVRALLRPVIRYRGMFEQATLEQVLKKGWDAVEHPAGRLVGEDCLELLAIDRPDAIATLHAGPPASWQLTLEQALEIARDNLRELTPDAFQEFMPGVYAGDWKDSYDISRALLPDVLHRIPVRGAPVFMLPERDALLVAGAADPQALRLMARAALEISRDGRPVSAGIYTYEDRRIVPFMHDDPEIQRCQDELRRDFEHDHYAQQKRVLETIHEAQDEDIFVATCMRFAENTDGDGRTDDDAPAERTVLLSTWTEGVETSLPKTDHIALLRLDDEQAETSVVVAWDTAMPLIGHLLVPERALYPPRFRLQGFPTDAQFAELEATQKR